MPQPAVAVGFAALVAFDVEMLAEGFELALNAAQIPLEARVLELLVQFAGGDLAPARDAAQQLHHQQRGFQGVGALGHLGQSFKSVAVNAAHSRTMAQVSRWQ